MTQPDKTIASVAQRYSGLATEDCCLSCGGALDLAKPAPGEICVDLGSGRGRDVIRMAEEVGPEGFAYGIDVAEGMLTTARRTAAKLGVTNVEFRHSPLDELPLPDGLAHLVISNCTINHASDKDAVWREIFRVLRPGGRYVVSDIYALAEVPAEYRNDPEAVAECWAGAVTRQTYLDSLTRAGFVAVQVLEESRPYAKGSVDVASFTVAGRRPSACCCGR